MITLAPISKAAPGWSPSPFQAPLLRPAPKPSPTLAQAVTATPATPPGSTVIINPPPPPPAFVDSAAVGAIVAGVGAYAWYTMTRAFYDAKWYKTSILTGGMTLLLAAKTAIDLWDLRVR